MTNSPSKQYLLGISAYYHDSSAALLCNGILVAAIAEERLSKIKHDKSFPRLAIEYCLEEAGISSADLDSVVFYEEPSLKFSRILNSSLAAFPHSWSFFYGAMRHWLTDRLWTKIKICSVLNINPDKVSYIPHHISHAAHAFFNSPFEKSGIVTVDATGEWTCTSIAVGNRLSPQPIKLVEEILYPDSLGLVYSAFTAFLGFEPNSEECSTMALAGFGRPTYENKINTLIKQHPQQTYRIDQSQIDITSLGENIFSEEFLGRFGKPRSPSQRLPFNCFDDTSPEYPDNMMHYANIASSLQSVFEKNLFVLADKAMATSGSSNLCIAGGVANNCVAIQKLAARYGAKNIYVPLDPGDGGSAIGAVMAHYFRLNKKSAAPLTSAYLGKGPQTEVLADVLRNMHTLNWSRYLPAGTHPVSSMDLVVTHFTSETALIEETASQLAQGKIIGWVQGRSEFGPRALGNRSILAHPARLDVVKHLSERVKKRAAFRPYGLSLTDTAADILFIDPITSSSPAAWMQITATVKKELRHTVRGALAIDDTTRPQVCTRNQNPRYYRLLEQFGELSGMAALINTSFNEPGYPMVSSGMDAMISFVRMDFDTLVVDNVMIKKP